MQLGGKEDDDEETEDLMFFVLVQFVESYCIIFSAGNPRRNQFSK